MKKIKLLSVLITGIMALNLFAACGEINSPKVEHTHDYVSEITKQATCKEEGVMTYTCVDGDDSYTEVIPATGHKDDDKDDICDSCGNALSEKAYTNGLVFTLKEGSYVVTDYMGDSVNVTIPATYNGKSVVGIADNAFSSFKKLEKINIGKNVASIGKRAFSGTSLTYIEIPENVSNIGEEAFCSTNLKQIDYNAKNVTNYCSYIFKSCYNKIKVNVGANVTVIPDGLFKIYTSTRIAKLDITEVNFASNSKCETIGTEAFVFCEKLTQITLPNSLKKIASGAFSGSGLKSIVIPNSVTEIANGALSCENLEEVTIGNSVEYIGNSAFAHTLIKTVTIPNSVKTIDDYAFKNCTKLTNVTIGSNVEKIGIYAFLNCSSLSSVKFFDDTTWYYTFSKYYTHDKFSVELDVSDETAAASYLKKTYCDQYWYKK